MLNEKVVIQDIAAAVDEIARKHGVRPHHVRAVIRRTFLSKDDIRKQLKNAEANQLRPFQRRVRSRMEVLEKLEYYQDILDAVIRSHSKLDICETCGRGVTEAQVKILLPSVREAREGIKATVGVLKDFLLIFKQHEFQQKVLGALRRASPAIHRQVIRELKEERALTAGLLAQAS